MSEKSDKKLTVFYLDDCPYCWDMKRALEELYLENPAFRAIPTEWIEESREPRLAEKYDYYYVPSVFLGNRKLYEASPADRYADCKRKTRALLLSLLSEKEEI